MPKKKKEEKESQVKWHLVEFEILGASPNEVGDKISKALEKGGITSYRFTVGKETKDA